MTILKVFLLANTFALMGTFAMANEINKKDSEKKEETKSENVEAIELVEKKCATFEDHCGGVFVYCQEASEPWNTSNIDKYADAFCE